MRGEKHVNYSAVLRGELAVGHSRKLDRAQTTKDGLLFALSVAAVALMFVQEEQRHVHFDGQNAAFVWPASKQTATRAFQVELIPDGGTKKIQYTGQRLELKF